ncbi:MAG: DUF1232 domain-containing protein [Myxococcales bacterium]|jgi:uncharacterized membrane protein YkvA (DUF1232 family)|nr:DUF1232 domain-containing protein [Myxococcales bacterium]
MSDQDARFLEVFGTWLRCLGDDARALGEVLAAEDQPEQVRRPAAMGLSYLFKSLDLIDDGIESLGYVDDAFVVRVALSQIPPDVLERDETPEGLRKLAGQVEFVREFLGAEYERLSSFVEGLGELNVRGRSVQALLEDAQVREEFLADVTAWANRYEAPPLGQDAKNAVKLRAFLSTKLAS